MIPRVYINNILDAGEYTMNYKRIHDLIIKGAQNRITVNGYTEIHHIIPTSEGGVDDDSNKVILTAREHFLVHWLLYKDCPSMLSRATAFFMMCNVDPSAEKLRYRPISTVIAKSREVAAMHKSQLYKLKCWVHNNTGVKLHIFKEELETYTSMGWLPGSGYKPTDATKKKLRDINLNKPKPGKEFSERMSAIVKERHRLNPEQWKHTNETKKKLADLSVEKWKDPERAAKMASKSRSQVTCPHCGKVGNAVVMPRWHFDNCKDRK